jgi:hypothetical protein
MMKGIASPVNDQGYHLSNPEAIPEEEQTCRFSEVSPHAD